MEPPKRLRARSERLALGSALVISSTITWRPGDLVADRFHLARNVSDSLRAVVDRQSWALSEPTPLPVFSVSTLRTVSDAPQRPPNRYEQQRAAAAAAADPSCGGTETVRKWRTIRAMPKATSLSRATIRNYVRSVQVPKRATRRPVKKNSGRARDAPAGDQDSDLAFCRTFDFADEIAGHLLRHRLGVVLALDQNKRLPALQETVDRVLDDDHVVKLTGSGTDGTNYRQHARSTRKYIMQQVLKRVANLL